MITVFIACYSGSAGSMYPIRISGLGQRWRFRRLVGVAVRDGSIRPKSQFVSIDKSSRFNWNSSAGNGGEGVTRGNTAEATSATGARGSMAKGGRGLPEGWLPIGLRVRLRWLQRYLVLLSLTTNPSNQQRQGQQRQQPNDP